MAEISAKRPREDSGKLLREILPKHPRIVLKLFGKMILELISRKVFTAKDFILFAKEFYEFSKELKEIHMPTKQH